MNRYYLILSTLLAFTFQAAIEPAMAEPSHPSGEGWRLIKGTRSKDERYAFAWGIQGTKTPEFEVDDEGNQSTTPDVEGLANYIVDLSNGVILGKTKGQHCSDSPIHYGISVDLETSWSSGNEFLFAAQISSGRDSTFTADLYQLTSDGGGLTESVDLLPLINEAVSAALKKEDRYKAFTPESLDLKVSEATIALRGESPLLTVSVLGNASPDGADEGFFSATLSFPITGSQSEAAPKVSPGKVEFEESN